MDESTDSTQPAANRILAELRAPFAEMRETLASALPGLQAAHSLHYELLRQPHIAGDPAMRSFTHLELWELHTQISLAGLLQRALRGETTPGVMLSIGESVALLGYISPRAAAAWRAFMQGPTAALLPREVTALDRHLAEAAQAGRRLQSQAAAVRDRLQSLTGVPWIIPGGIALAIRSA